MQRMHLNMVVTIGCGVAIGVGAAAVWRHVTTRKGSANGKRDRQPSSRTIASLATRLNAISINGAITQECRQSFHAAWCQLDLDKPITIYLCTHGGVGAPMMAICDTILRHREHVRRDARLNDPRIVRCCISEVATSAGTQIAFACDEVLALPYATISAFDTQIGMIGPQGQKLPSRSAIQLIAIAQRKEEKKQVMTDDFAYLVMRAKRSYQDICQMFDRCARLNRWKPDTQAAIRSRLLFGTENSADRAPGVVHERHIPIIELLQDIPELECTWKLQQDPKSLVCPKS